MQATIIEKTNEAAYIVRVRRNCRNETMWIEKQDRQYVGNFEPGDKVEVKRIANCPYPIFVGPAKP